MNRSVKKEEEEMEQPRILSYRFTSNNALKFYNKRPEITEEEIRFIQTHLKRFPRKV